MRIDETHRPWLLFSGSVSGAVDSWVRFMRLVLACRAAELRLGLTYGIVGYAMMVFAGLLSVRKKFRVLRIGRAKSWMKGHIWLGFLAFPLILYHAAFGFGGSLTKSLCCSLRSCGSAALWARYCNITCR